MHARRACIASARMHRSARMQAWIGRRRPARSLPPRAQHVARSRPSPSSHTTQANQWHTGLHPAYNSQVERVVVVPPGALLLLLGHRQGAAGGLRARLSLEGLEQLARTVDLLKRGAVVAAP